MKKDMIVYRSTHPAVMASWAVLNDARKAQSDALHAFASEVDPEHERGLIIQGARIVGLAHQSDWSVPDGWRVVNRGVLHIVPRLNTKAGKLAAKRIQVAQLPDPRRMLADGHGIPTGFFGESDGAMRFHECGIRRIEDALYVTWGAEPDQPHDPDKWEPVKLSEFYAAVEAAEAEAV